MTNEGRLVDPTVLRETLGHYPTGVAVITAIDSGGEPTGMVVGSFTSVSMDPPLVSYMPMRASRTYSRLRTSRRFCVNVLAADQLEYCRAFASPGVDKFAGVGWGPAPAGSPILDGAVSWIECEVTQELEGGDHYIVLGQVRDLRVERPAPPLLFFQGGYGRFSLPSPPASSDAELIDAVRMAETVREPLEQLAADLGAKCSVVAKVGDDAAFVMSSDQAGGHGGSATIGNRMPLIPPLGAVFYADAPATLVDDWLARARVSDEEVAGFRTSLQAVRERGYSLSLLPESEVDRSAVLNDYSSAEALPEHERRIRRMIAETAVLYDPVLEHGGRYDLHSIVVPVPHSDGQARIALRLSRLPQRTELTTIERWVSRLHAVADAAGAVPVTRGNDTRGRQLRT